MQPISNRTYSGNDNYGRPKSNYIQKIAAMTDEELGMETYGMIYQSARCHNNPRADWHWMADACHDEATKRDPSASIYTKAYNRCFRDHAVRFN